MSIRFHIQKLATFNGTPGCFLHGLKSLAKKYPVKIRMLPVTLFKMTRFPLQTMSLMNTNYGEYYTNEIVRINTTSFAVRFRFIVFRPFVDEILVGKIRSCSTEGVRGTVYMCITLFSGSVIHADVRRNLASYPQGVNFLCDVLVCRATPPLLPYLRKHCLMPSSHTKLCSSFYFGCQLCQAFLTCVLRMVCMEMIATVSFCCVSSFQFL